ncbi:MAG: type II secretion system F family protein, partial [Nitrosopumilaceae archaeon]
MQKTSTHTKKNDLADIPKPSFIYSQKFRVVVPSVIVGMGIILASLYYVSFSENTSIRDVGVIFGILAMIVPLTMLQVKESQRKDSIDRNLP